MSHHYDRRTRKPTTRCTVCGAEIPTALADPTQCPVTLASVEEYRRMVNEVEAGRLPSAPAPMTGAMLRAAASAAGSVATAAVSPLSRLLEDEMRRGQKREYVRMVGTFDEVWPSLAELATPDPPE